MQDAGSHTRGPLRSGGDLATLGRRVFVRVGPLPILLVVLGAYFYSQNPTLLSGGNLTNVSAQMVFLLLIAVGQMLVLVSGGFDLSVGANVSLTSIVSAKVMSSHYAGHPDEVMAAILLGALAAIVVGTLIGVANGVGVALFGVNPFIVTLATGSMLGGITMLVSHGAEVGGLPTEFVVNIGSDTVAGVPVPLLIAAPVILLLYLVVAWTRYGRYLYAIGSSAAAAHVAGVRVWLNVLATYVLCSVMTAIAAFLLTARVSSGQPTIGAEFTLQSITAAIIGGASLRGGEGGFAGTIFGVVFVMLLGNGMNLMRLDDNDQAIALGVALMVAVIIDRRRARARAVLASQEAQRHEHVPPASPPAAPPSAAVA